MSKDVVVQIRCTEEQRRKMQAGAAADGVSLSVWCRDRLLAGIEPTPPQVSILENAEEAPEPESLEALPLREGPPE